jgi:hypothetical protein
LTKALKVQARLRDKEDAAYALRLRLALDSLASTVVSLVDAFLEISLLCLFL